MKKTMNWFMNGKAKELPEEQVVVSKRFVDDDGKPIPFEIKAIGQSRVEEVMEECTKPVTKKGRLIDERLDKSRFVARLVVESTVYPDFKDKELLKSYGVVDPAELVKGMLLAGEYSCLVESVQKINGFDADFDELVEEAKN